MKNNIIYIDFNKKREVTKDEHIIASWRFTQKVAPAEIADIFSDILDDEELSKICDKTKLERELINKF
jgi:hypothetical protein